MGGVWAVSESNAAVTPGARRPVYLAEGPERQHPRRLLRKRRVTGNVRREQDHPLLQQTNQNNHARSRKSKTFNSTKWANFTTSIPFNY